MGDVISSHLDEAKREIITGEERFVEVLLGECSFWRLGTWALLRSGHGLSEGFYSA